MDNVQPGQELGPYRIISQIGEGGMATVYKAYHAAMDRYVALKVLPPELARSPAFKGRFQQEARLIANLEHPHILPIHDVGESGGLHFFVMRFLDTGTLTRRIEAGPLALPEIDRIISQVADALGYAHQRGVIHRDVKPSNVLLDSRGDVFLTDFGIAKILEGSSKFTTTGNITGTPAYMSPEQAQGDPVDGRSDIYSLGIVLYEMVAGRVPFEAETPMAVALKHINAPLPLPSSLKPGVDPEIERVLLKTLAKDRGDRYQTCQEFAEAWKRAYAVATALGRAASVPPPPPAPPADATVIAPTGPGAPRRRPWGLITALSFAGLLVTVVVCMGLLLAWNYLARGGFLSTPAATGAADTNPAPGSTTAAAGGQWQSWPGGNAIFNIVAVGDAIYTGGPGGVTVWNSADGSVIRQITTQHGLPDELVDDIVVDADGSLWISTPRGVAYAQSSGITVYSRQDGLDDDVVGPLLRLRDGRLLAGTTFSETSGSGLNVFDGARWSDWPGFPSVSPDAEGSLSTAVGALAESAEGILWVGTDSGLGRWDGQTWTRFTAADGLPDNIVTRLNFDRQGNLLIGTHGGAALYDGQTLTAFSIENGPHADVYGLSQDEAGRYWFAASGGVSLYDPASGAWRTWSNADSDLLTYDSYGGTLLSDGRFLIGTRGMGLVLFTAEGPQPGWKVPNSPTGGTVLRIVPAPDGQLWFLGPWANDLFDPASGLWQDRRPEFPGGLLKFDPQGNMWTNVYPNGVYIVASDGRQTQLNERHGFGPEQLVNDVAFGGDGAVWLATWGGLATFDGKTVTTVATGLDFGLPETDITKVYAASDGSLWLAGQHLLARRKPDGTTETFGVGNPFGVDQVQVLAIQEDKQGRLWFGTHGEGVYRYTDGRWEQFIPTDPGVSLPSLTIRAIALAPDGSLLFATDGGLAHLAGAVWTSVVSGPDTLMNSEVNDVYVTADGVVFVATAGGISRFAP